MYYYCLIWCVFDVYFFCKFYEVRIFFLLINPRQLRPLSGFLTVREGTARCNACIVLADFQVKVYLPCLGEGWWHLFSGHTGVLLEEKCRPRPRYRTGAGVRRNRLFSPLDHSVEVRIIRCHCSP